jgi:hypothetical protein
MTGEHLRATRDANPFQAFTIHLTDGRSFRIPHRDYLSMTLGGRTAIVYHGHDSLSIVDVRLITELRIENASAQGAES